MRRPFLNISLFCSDFYSFLTIALLIGLGYPSLAQDGHYWSENYGNKSMLLSGTVNASVEDLGAVFYNPARLGLINNPAFAISAKVYEFRTTRIKNDGSDGLSLNKSVFGGAPSLAAGTFKVPFLEGHKFAYSFLTRQRTNADFFARVEEEGNITDYLPGDEIFTGKLDTRTDFREEWMGITWAPPSEGKIGFGISTFLSTINKTNKIKIDMNALNQDNLGGYYSVLRQYSYESFGLLWKLGMAGNFEWMQVGLTVTTPRIHGYGKGSTIYEEYLVGLDTTGDGNRNDQFIYNIQNNIKNKYKSPWAIGLGVGIPFGKGTFHLSAEWYSKINKYEMFSIDPFTAQSTGDTIEFVLIEELHSILNYGLGIEWHFNERLSVYGSIATDYSAVPTQINGFGELATEVNNSIFQMDFLQFGGGLAVKTKPIEITVGATYRGGIQDLTTDIHFPGELQNQNGETTRQLIFNNWRFILGFSFPFADKLTKNLSED